jgi:acetoacetyl-CoA synthetase
LVAFLATASLGAVWASVSPEFGVRSVLDRVAQIEPKVLLVVNGYTYRDTRIDRRAEVAAIVAGLQTVQHVVEVAYGDDASGWLELVDQSGPLEFEQVDFAHPLYVLFSSGTTGLPKAIVHGHGGILLEHVKNLGLGWDLKPGGRLFWFTTTAWMMWNALVSALLLRSSIVMLDGDPAWPDLAQQWRLASETRPSVIGVSPAFVMACRKAGLTPGRDFDLSSVRVVPIAGSPLPGEGYDWLYEQLGPDMLLVNGSGGTDVCSAIVSGSALTPVHRGEMAGRWLGVDATAFDFDGNEVTGELGELVIRRPMPSMPVGFWGDDDGSRYRDAYFDMYPGVWRQGDWVRFSEAGTCIVTGRSDATLNRGGVRLGTSEFYSVVEELDEVEDALVVHLEDRDELVLFVVASLDDELRARIVSALRSQLSPRHVPDTITAVPSIPRTLTGKKLEAPVKRILRGEPADAVASRGALTDPDAMAAFVEFARERG